MAAARGFIVDFGRFLKILKKKENGKKGISWPGSWECELEVRYLDKEHSSSHSTSLYRRKKWYIIISYLNPALNDLKSVIFYLVRFNEDFSGNIQFIVFFTTSMLMFTKLIFVRRGCFFEGTMSSILLYVNKKLNNFSIKYKIKMLWN